ncbi:uncharacterized protein HD556DRAFT_1371319 [Suillus plorans]|uniref:Hydrophobin n=1 Tax=Suillus plorans TaxID=116603 RepID=A0A9P7ARG9_9AGAM|nr:uncharacterized protein HD556DRAFT_1371319 [Suillus plorans]KAG1794156.1 hypothetical protein HD556DRAFT_1371319 [Suillus plorans]
MHFSFIRVIAVVAALTRIMPVSADWCAPLGHACGPTSPERLDCCVGPLVCPPLRLVPVRKYHRVLPGEVRMSLANFIQFFLTPRPDSRINYCSVDRRPRAQATCHSTCIQ